MKQTVPLKQSKTMCVHIFKTSEVSKITQKSNSINQSSQNLKSLLLFQNFFIRLFVIIITIIHIFRNRNSSILKNASPGNCHGTVMVRELSSHLFELQHFFTRTGLLFRTPQQFQYSSFTLKQAPKRTTNHVKV